jgi:putative transposase
MSQLFFAATRNLALCPTLPAAITAPKELHFITCSCYHRQPWLASPQRRDLFLAVFEEVRQRYRFVVVGYVVMPDHIHLLISEPEKGDPSRVMQAIKQGFSRRVLKAVRKRRVAAQQELFAVGSEHVWQRRFYDFNVWTARKRIEKLRYMHRNPVARGLVQEPEQWPWSSYRSYAFGEEGAVRINQWGEAKIKIPTPAA